MSADGYTPDSPRISAVRWTKLDCPPISPPRSGHVAFGLGIDDLYVFGGYAEERDGDEIKRYVKNDLWRWRGSGGGWAEAKQGGDVPGPRLASAAAEVDGRLYLFGGWDPQTPGTGGVILDAVHALDPAAHTWSDVPVAMPDGPTSRHVALTLPGGREALVHTHRCVDHVLVFDGAKFRKQKTRGEGPSSRGLHAAVMCGRHAVIFGGAAQSGEMSNESFLLDTDEWTWTELTIEGDDAPSPRAAASAFCSLTDSCALLFGGAESTEGGGLNPRSDLWALRFDPSTGKGRWELLLDEEDGDGSVPPARNAATLSEIGAPPEGVESGEGRRYFLLQGGWAPFRETWSAPYALSVDLD